MCGSDRLRRVFRAFRSRSGAVSIEFALIAPLFLMFIFFGMQLSIGMYKLNTIERAVEQATRQAFLSGAATQSDIQASVTSHLQAIDPSLDLTIAYQTDTSTTVPMGNVTADYTFEIYAFFVPKLTLRSTIDVDVPLPQT